MKYLLPPLYIISKCDNQLTKNARWWWYSRNADSGISVKQDFASDYVVLTLVTVTFQFQTSRIEGGNRKQFRLEILRCIV